jgi:predicted alpha/beta-fold hydrolase
MGNDRFQASWWLLGGHGQTLWLVLTRRVRLDVRSERLELPEGDFVRLDWSGAGGPIVIVVPGLQGDLGSAYVRGLLRAGSAVFTSGTSCGASAATSRGRWRCWAMTWGSPAGSCAG